MGRRIPGRPPPAIMPNRPSATRRRRTATRCRALRLARIALALTAAALSATARAATDPGAAAVVPLHVVGDGVPRPLAGAQGDATRGRALVVARNPANCVLCHAVPDPAVRFAGDLGPSLAGAGARLSAAQLRLRVADSRRLNPATIMPSYYRADGLVNVASSYRGMPVLTAREVEDIVAWLATLR
jgi:sulfur-oxidizing protein SoxX